MNPCTYCSAAMEPLRDAWAGAWQAANNACSNSATEARVPVERIPKRSAGTPWTTAWISEVDLGARGVAHRSEG